MQYYYSIIIAASNAGYGGNFLQRLQACVNNKFELCQKYQISAELIIVEWNPPGDQSDLAHAIDWSHSTIPTKIISVPRDLHNTYRNPGGFSFLEYMAKNVGIRRSRGRYILCTNADVIFSDELGARLAQQDLQEQCFYRVNRSDLDEHGRVFQINYANGTFAPGEPIVNVSKTGVPYAPYMLHFNAAGDFTMMSRGNWFHLRGYPENTGYLVTLDGEMVWLAASNGLRQDTFPETMLHQHHHHSGTSEKPWYMPPQGWSDAHPRGTRNEDLSWGLNGRTLEETIINVPLEVQAESQDRGDFEGVWDAALLDYPLDQHSVVMDVGAYTGDWAVKVAQRYHPVIYIFEPVQQFFREATRRLAQLGANFYAYDNAVGSRNQTMQIHRCYERSSFFQSGSEIETVEMKDIAELNLPDVIDLISINIEGGEYELLERMIQTGFIKRCRNIQIQFHPFVPNATQLKFNIRERLKLTHQEMFYYPFVWEGWRLK